jgi:hypothetical protein
MELTSTRRFHQASQRKLDPRRNVSMFPSEPKRARNELFLESWLRPRFWFLAASTENSQG